VTGLDSLLYDRRPAGQFTVYAAADAGDVDPFGSLDVAVDRRRLPPGAPGPFLVVRSDGEFAGAISLSSLTGLLEPPVSRPGDREGVSEGYRVLFDALDDALNRAMNRRQLLAVSREIEDRAYRAGTGTLRVAFQRLSTFRSQADVYRHLTADTDLDVHVYGLPDWTPPDVEGLTYHRYSDETLAPYWILAFDGGEDRQPCALVARESADGYDGVWTDDPGTTAAVLAELEAV
jgi:hypothetical protein